MNGLPFHLLRFVGVAATLPGMVGCLPTLDGDRTERDLAEVTSEVPETWTADIDWSSDASEGWLADFSGSGLQNLVKEAVATNPSLRAVAARVEQSRALVVITTADLLPSLDGSGSASRTQSPGDQRFPGVGQRANRFRMGLNVAWELDLWGRLSDDRRAQLADLQASESDYHAARLSLAANTTLTALGLAEIQELLRLIARDVETRETQMGILERQLDRGIDPERVALDVSLSRSDLARIRSSRAEQLRLADEARRQLETWLGRYPAGQEEGLSSLPRLTRGVPEGLPSELLLRRPDILAAELRLRAALGRESAARKAFLPSIRLTADRGFSTQELDNLISTPSTIWSIASQLSQPLFEGGRLWGGVKRAEARYEEALQDYADTVLTAFREVETALAADRYFQMQEQELEVALNEARTSEKLAMGQYERGLTEILTLLDSRRRAFDAERALISTQTQRLRNRVDLHLALGGEFE